MSVEWAAGLFEGEGSIDTKLEHRPNDRSYRYPRLQLSMTDEDVVRRYAEVVGGRAMGPYPNGEGHKDVWRCTLTHRAAERAMVLLLPHLGARRSARWAEVMEQRGRCSS